MVRSLSFPLLLFVLLGILVSTVFAVPVPVEDDAYRLLERWEVLGYLDSPLSGSKPYSRVDVAKRLLQVEDHRSSLTRVDVQELDLLLFRYQDEIAQLTGTGQSDFRPSWDSIPRWGYLDRLGLFRNHQDLYSVYGKDWGILLNASIEMQQYTTEACDPEGTEGGFSVFGAGYEMRGYWNHISISAQARDSQVSGDGACVDSISFPYRKFGNNTSNGDFDFYDTWSSVEYQIDHLRLSLGRWSNYWGMSESGSLTFSDRTLPYTQFGITANFGPFELKMIQGKLIQEPALEYAADSLTNQVVRKHYADKWVAAHRIQVNIAKFLQIGVFEQVYYGERGLDLEYLAPVAFYRGIEHYTRDQDNMLLGFNLRAVVLKRVTLYGQIIIDDLKVSQLGSENRIHNKFGALAGMKVFDPIPRSNTRLTIEYVRLTPYLYTHKYPINVPQHYGVNMGYPLQPNSDQLLVQVDWTPIRPLHLSGRVVHLRHGSNPEDGPVIGGNVREPLEYGGEKIVKFLDGDLYKETQIELSGKLEVAFDVFLEASVKQVYYSHDKADTGLLEADGITVAVGFAYNPLP